MKNNLVCCRKSIAIKVEIVNAELKNINVLSIIVPDRTHSWRHTALSAISNRIVGVEIMRC